MFFSLSRLLISPTYLRTCPRLLNQVSPIIGGSYTSHQMDYIKSILNQNETNWSAVRETVLSMQGNINQKNIDGVLLKYLVSRKDFDSALSYANHLKNLNDELSLGSINGLLGLFYEMAKGRSLSDSDKTFILDMYKSLYNKYKVLDYSTCERLLHALCAIDEHEKALKVLDNIELTSVPTHSAFSTLIATLFKNNKKKKAFELIEKSMNRKRPLQDIAYEEWINYILRKYKEKKTQLKYLDEVCSHISRNCAVISVKTANLLKDTYSLLNYGARFTRIHKTNGECLSCKTTLDCLKLSEEEFSILQKNVKDKLIVGSDLFLKTSPEELNRFLKFVEMSAPYDIVLDALNIAYAIGKGTNMNKINLLHSVVDHFRAKNKKILLLGRKHMVKWHPKSVQNLTAKTCSFFTDNLSQDDPFFITAAILSGSHTDIVSKDLLRGHSFRLKDDNLQQLFKRWQWQHQWMIYLKINKTPNIQPPLTFTPCAQKNNNGWHLPYEREHPESNNIQLNDGTPDLSSWLCISSKAAIK